MSVEVLVPALEPLRGSARPAQPGGPLGGALIALPDAGRAGRLAQSFQEAGVLPTLAFTEAQVLASVEARRFGLLVLDPVLGGPRPRAFLRGVRARSDAAVLALGGDDPAMEPLLDALVHELVPGHASAGEVAARGAALLELRGVPGVRSVVRWGPLELDLARRQASWWSRPLHLTPLELRVLGVLVQAGGAVVTVSELERLVWGTAGPGDRERVFAHVRRIRRKIEPDPSRPTFLLTVRGEGFRVQDP